MNRIIFLAENKKGNHECSAYVTGDASKSKKGLIVLQEWWGLNKQIDDEAAMIAKMGEFLSIVPNLHHGKITKDYKEASQYMDNLDWTGAVKDIRGAARYLKSKGCTKIGVTGFGIGGALTLAAAALVPEIDAAAPFYGIPADSVAEVSKINIPLQCHFAAKDSTAFASPDLQKDLRGKLDAGKVDYEWKTYDTDHAFTNATSPNFNKEYCGPALKEMVEFMKTNLS